MLQEHKGRASNFCSILYKFTAILKFISFFILIVCFLIHLSNSLWTHGGLVLFTFVSQHPAHSRLFNQQLCLNGCLYMLTVLSATSSVWPNEDQAKGEAAPRRQDPRNLSPAQTKWTRWADRKRKEGFPRLRKHKCKTELRNSWLVPVKTVVAAAEMSHEGPFSHTKFRFYWRYGQI